MEKCDLLKLLLELSNRTLVCFLFPSHTRASDIETAQQIFWKQADFGYVHERLSEVKTHCKPAATVGISDRSDALHLFLKIIFVVDRILLVLNRGIHLWPAPSTFSTAEQQTCTLIYELWRETTTGLWFAWVIAEMGWQGKGFENWFNKAGLFVARGFTFLTFYCQQFHCWSEACCWSPVKVCPSSLLAAAGWCENPSSHFYGMMMGDWNPPWRKRETFLCLQSCPSLIRWCAKYNCFCLRNQDISCTLIPHPGAAFSDTEWLRRDLNADLPHLKLKSYLLETGWKTLAVVQVWPSDLSLKSVSWSGSWVRLILPFRRGFVIITACPES